MIARRFSGSAKKTQNFSYKIKTRWKEPTQRLLIGSLNGQEYNKTQLANNFFDESGKPSQRSPRGIVGSGSNIANVSLRIYLLNLFIDSSEHFFFNVCSGWRLKLYHQKASHKTIKMWKSSDQAWFFSLSLPNV